MEFISFGPCCLGAELLKSLGLRNCTYGFDWSRSGSISHQEFLKHRHKFFLSSSVEQPSIKLEQKINPRCMPNKTSELSQKRLLYGFPYTYNPHRSLNDLDDIMYLRRSFARLDAKLNSPNISNNCTIVLSHYKNKPENNYFKCINKSGLFLKYCFLLYRQIEAKIRIIEYEVVSSMPKASVHYNKTLYGDKVSVKIPEAIDKNADLRRVYYRKLTSLFQ